MKPGTEKLSGCQCPASLGILELWLLKNGSRYSEFVPNSSFDPKADDNDFKKSEIAFNCIQLRNIEALLLEVSGLSPNADDLFQPQLARSAYTCMKMLHRITGDLSTDSPQYSALIDAKELVSNLYLQIKKDPQQPNLKAKDGPSLEGKSEDGSQGDDSDKGDDDKGDDDKSRNTEKDQGNRKSKKHGEGERSKKKRRGKKNISPEEIIDEDDDNVQEGSSNGVYGKRKADDRDSKERETKKAKSKDNLDMSASREEE